MWKIRELQDRVTNIVYNYTETEALVREATNEDPWGPTGPQMKELARLTYSYEFYQEVMQMLWKRMLVDPHKSWRRVYKSLLVLSYLLRNGSERVVTSTREHSYDLKGLKNYHFIDDAGKDQGINVRQKVKELIEFAHDDDRLRDERRKSRKTKDKFTSVSSDTYSGDGDMRGDFSISSFKERDPSPSYGTGQESGRGFRDSPSPQPGNGHDTAEKPPPKYSNGTSTSFGTSGTSARLSLPKSTIAPKKKEPDLIGMESSQSKNDFGEFTSNNENSGPADDFGGFKNAPPNANQSSVQVQRPALVNSQSLIEFTREQNKQTSIPSPVAQTSYPQQNFANFKETTQPITQVSNSDEFSLFTGAPTVPGSHNLTTTPLSNVSAPFTAQHTVQSTSVNFDPFQATLSPAPSVTPRNLDPVQMMPTVNLFEQSAAVAEQSIASPSQTTSFNMPSVPLSYQQQQEPLIAQPLMPLQANLSSVHNGEQSHPGWNSQGIQGTSTNNTASDVPGNQASKVGSTWSGASVDIDLSGLNMSPSKGKKTPGPSLNSLKASSGSTPITGSFSSSTGSPALSSNQQNVNLFGPPVLQQSNSFPSPTLAPQSFQIFQQ